MLHNVAAERLHFTDDVKEGVRFGMLQVIAVGALTDEDGTADTQPASAPVALPG